MDRSKQVIDPLPPEVQECIDAYGRYYAEQHKLGMSVRDDMKYVASVAIRSVAVPEIQALDRGWMAKHINNFASHFLQRYDKQGSLREGLMYAFTKTFDGVEPSPTTAKEAGNWPTMDVEVLIKALQRIARWQGEFPAVNGLDGKPSTYGVEYGSNGERDFMRQVATEALKAAPGAVSATGRIEIRNNEDGTLDEAVLAHGPANFHLEQLDNGVWWMALTLGKRRVDINLYAKGKITANVSDEGDEPTETRSATGERNG